MKRVQFVDCMADKLIYAFLKNGLADMTGGSKLPKYISRHTPSCVGPQIYHPLFSGYKMRTYGQTKRKRGFNSCHSAPNDQIGVYFGLKAQGIVNYTTIDNPEKKCILFIA
jgi:hypothetical protein